jgi:hypothetical protein
MSERTRKIIEGLTILAKYEGESVAAEHDKIYAGPSTTDDISPDDRVRLEELKWLLDDEVGSWFCFV